MHVIKEMLHADVLCGADLLDIEVTCGFGCDLISDSLCFARPGCLLLTGLTNVQIIRLAEMVEARAIVFVRGKKPGEDVIKLAREKGLPLLATDLFLFESCGILYQAGLRSS
ncbi:DRTGG domain-containing protein [Desulfofundulus thermosubterraneus]|uniref:DRTGG domain-containing protein n=1 Tax=Desulfofundulus thermosubterraneus DSM 16057 TaxID=1121432 RepID=A0A1M6EN85_9FIRM|nr:DRTGG domain-containing protein [Desulfofundulus thermosubterraneus]SHI86906.1 DRTGG domain-containing protein [Desulfofundulus thermosubterraneus DSM 16057]